MGGAYLRSRIKQAGKWDQETIVSFFLCQYCSGEYLHDGGVRVLNRGQDEQGEWREAEGRAYFVGDSDEGRLKVSFFGPFYGSYNVLATDYDLSLVSSYNLQYLWILSRTPHPPKEKVEALVERARGLGFATDRLIWVSQDPAGNAP